jgi:hypothetical protein
MLVLAGLSFSTSNVRSVKRLKTLSLYSPLLLRWPLFKNFGGLDRRRMEGEIESHPQRARHYPHVAPVQDPEKIANHTVGHTHNYMRCLLNRAYYGTGAHPEPIIAAAHSSHQSITTLSPLTTSPLLSFSEAGD